MQNKKIAFFGTPSFTVQFLELFKSLGLDITLIVTGEDKPVGRGQIVHPPGPKLWTLPPGHQSGPQLEGAPSVLQPKKLDDEFYNELKKVDFDLFIVIAYGKIIPEKVINLPKFGTINLHYSLLPKYRGASPVESAILVGEKETGITIQQMVYKLDAGDILYQEKVQIQPEETAIELRSRLNQRALEIFPEFLENLFSNSLTSYPQDESEASICKKYDKEDLDVTMDLKDLDLVMVYRKYKAYDKKIYFFHDYRDKSIRVKITGMNSTNILKLLPESKKEITLQEFEQAFGKIFN